MITLLYLLGVPLWLLLGWFAGALWHRREIGKSFPNMFKLKVRVIDGEYRHLDGNFSRPAALGIWAHDILIIEKGLLLARNLHFPVDDPIRPPEPADPEHVKGLGVNPVTMQFLLDNQAIIEIAVAGDVVDLAKGPFWAESNQQASQEE